MNDQIPLHILLVEDSSLTAEQLCELIRTVSHRVTISVIATQKEAIAMLDDKRPDLVVLDLKLKQGSGFGVLREIAMQQPKPLIVTLTNYALPKYRELALLMGADYFLDKARDFSRLPSIIESIVSRESGAVLK